jgi:uncharacterized OsmC-like protein
MGSITTFYKGDMLFECQMGNHSVSVDVPASMGGSDRAATPPEFFIASLGSCIGAFVAQYCNRTGINAEGMTVDITFEKADEPTRLKNIKATVNLPNGDVGGRKEAILRVADHCPVHETISTMEDLEIVLNARTEKSVA